MSLIQLPRLNKGELYSGGIILPDGHIRHTILLPGEHKGLNFNKAQEWCKKQGGHAPERIDQSLLFKFLKKEFRPVAYWSCEQSAYGSSWAWFQDFYDGFQYCNQQVLRAGRARRPQRNDLAI
jgi:hypothetical protein